MNRHLDDGQLRAALDGELDADALGHLAECVTCQARQKSLQLQMNDVARKLDFLDLREQERVPAARPALERFYTRKLAQKEIPMLKRLFASPAVRYVALAVLILTLIVAIPATRALADQVLNLFRVQQVTVVPVDFTGLEQLNGNGTLSKQVSQLISDSVTVKEIPGEPVEAKDAADASQKAGFTVRLPQSSKFSRLSVQGAAGFDFTINQAKAQALIDEAGRSDLVLPKDIDGAVVSVTVPASIRADFGSCPDPSTDQSLGGGSAGRRYADCVILSEIPSPSVDAPASVNVAQLAQIGLEFTGMSSDQAAAFVKSVDWTSTLVVPIPRNAATYEQVQVDGVTGTLIQRPADDAPQYVLIWVKNGIVYSIGGLGADSQQAIDMANSLK